MGLDPRDFELAVSELLRQSGLGRVEATRYSQDGGVDVNAWLQPWIWPLREHLTQVQAKRWMHTVGRREVAELRGSLQPHASGCIATTSHFSRAALSEAGAPGRVPIALIDGHEMARIVVAVSRQDSC